jgi:cephalosporin-C deacetylase-like acetyl esterase
MANAIYPKAKEKFLDALIDIPSDTIKIALIDTGTYTYNSADEFWSSASSAIVGTAVTLASKTITSGVFDAADVTFTSVSGVSVEALIIYKDTGSAATSPLIMYIDVAASGLPVTPNGNNIEVQFNASGIFAL